MSLAHTATAGDKPTLDMTLRLKLSVMMFLQFAIWGSWFVIMGNYLVGMGFDKGTIGAIYGTMALGTIFSPMFIGQVADRFFHSERLMAVLHLGGAGLLYLMGQTTNPTAFYWIALAYALVYSPTLALSNSIAFTHVPDGARDFPGLRVLGTVGWIVANLIVGSFLDVKTNQPFLLGAGFSVALGILSLGLPATPPPGKAGDAFPFVKAVGLLKDFSFAVFFGVSFVITIVLAFYYGFTGIYLESGVHLAGRHVATVMTIGQFAELLLLPFLPFFLKRMGMKWVLAVGMLAWGIRYLLFSVYAKLGVVELYPLVLLGIALHGICFDFFFAAGFIHVDNKAPADIRGSGQALFTFLTYGLGMWLGNVVSGLLGEFYSSFDPVMAGKVVALAGSQDGYGVLLAVSSLLAGPTKQTDWAAFWLVPAIGVLICFAVFVLLFRDTKNSRAA